MSNQQFYPTLNDLLPVENIPLDLGSFDEDLAQLLEKIFYKDLQIAVSPLGEAASYRLTLVLFNQIGLEIPNTGGLALVLNPGQVDASTEIPVSVSWRLDILKYIQDLKLADFDPTPRGFFDLFLDIFEISPKDLFYELITVFIDEPNAILAFLDTYNAQYANPITSYTGIEDLITQIEAHEDLLNVIFDTQINTDPAEVLENVKELFTRWIGNISFDEILTMFIPQARIGLDGVTVAVKFPRSILIPLEDNPASPDYGEPKPEPERSQLQFDVGRFYVSTEDGFSYEQANNISFTKSQIPGFGLSLEATNLKVDLSKTRNIPEADSDGRSPDFTGVYAQQAIIGLGDFWKKDDVNSTAQIKGTDLVIGTGGFSGTVALEAVDPNDPNPPVLAVKIGDNGFELALTRFEATFSKNAVLSSTIEGTMKIPNFKDANGDDAVVNILGGYVDDGFFVTAAEPDGILFNIADKIEVVLNELTLGRKSGNWYFTLKGSTKRLFSLPAIGDMLPETVSLNHLTISQGEEASFDIGFKWEDGFSIQATNEEIPDILVPINKTLLGIFDIKTMLIGIRPQNPGLDVLTVINGGVEIGPIYGGMDHFGLTSQFRFPEAEDGVLGPMDVGLAVDPPSKVAIKIDAKAIKGGGALYFDKEKGRYTGALELKVGGNKKEGKSGVQIKAIGILQTELPDGADGFSLLVMITAEFDPIDLGLGFTLNGVGGLAGTHRTLALQALRDGVKNDSLDQILFPEDPVENLSQIVQQLDTAFPIALKRYTFGPMGILGYGTPENILTAELGLMIEVPNPIRLAILGVIKTVLPNEKFNLLQLQVNFVGTIDFEQKYITFDASLYDSRLLASTLSGDMAFRLKYGEDPVFLLTVGGFHPQFQPPPLNLPTLNRLTIALLNRENLKLTLQAYLALTSNTAQIGARVDLLFKITNKYGVEGFLGFDALFQFSPFYMTVSFQAMLALKNLKKNKVLLGGYIEATLEGPTPWKVYGKAWAQLGPLKLSKEFSQTWGVQEDTALPNVDVLPELQRAIEAKPNWTGQLPPQRSLQVSLKNTELEDEIILHPYGLLALNQKVVPLGVDLEKFGQQRPSGANHFELEITDDNEVALDGVDALQEYFAPGDFEELTSTEKLSRPSFEKMRSGLVVNADGELRGEFFRQVVAEYEHVVMESRYEPQLQVNAASISEVQFQAEWTNGSAGRSARGRNLRRFTRTATAPPKVSLQKPGYVIADLNDLSIHNNLQHIQTEAEAKKILKELVEAEPGLQGTLGVVAELELG